MKATVTWAGGMAFTGHAPSGHDIIMDASPDFGGEDKGMRPMEMVLLGMGGCTSIDVMSMLNKGRQDVTDCVVELSAERAQDIPHVFTKIHAHFKVTGKDIDPKRVERAIELSATKYCSASLMLAKTAEITHDFEIIDSLD